MPTGVIQTKIRTAEIKLGEFTNKCEEEALALRIMKRSKSLKQIKTNLACGFFNKKKNSRKERSILIYLSRVREFSLMRTLDLSLQKEQTILVSVLNDSHFLRAFHPSRTQILFVENVRTILLPLLLDR
jgi:5-formyltetrahydrofolate cyclo-ligase